MYVESRFYENDTMALSLHPRRHFSCLHMTRFLSFDTPGISSDAASWKGRSVNFFKIGVRKTYPFSAPASRQARKPSALLLPPR